MRRLVLGLAALLVLASGCGSSGGSGLSVTIGRASTFQLAGFAPTAPITPGKPVTVKFHIRQPSGQTLTAYKHGAGPHTGVHLIAVRDDLSVIIHQHPPVTADGTLSTQVTFPKPGRYRIVVDAYPASASLPRNFQLTRDVTVRGRWKPRPLAATPLVQHVAGYRIALRKPAPIRELEGESLHITLTDPHGKPVTPTPWFGATAHAVFFRQGSLDYFHTHVCAPNAKACLQAFGGAGVGHANKPGALDVGLVMPAAGRWRLFLQFRVGGHVITVPYTLQVKQ